MRAGVRDITFLVMRTSLVSLRFVSEHLPQMHERQRDPNPEAMLTLERLRQLRQRSVLPVPIQLIGFEKYRAWQCFQVVSVP